uniref:Fido domain-containing protein n=1 Tax=Globodera pallida TaxID=36090 RepID=A0A183C0R0_GLOPA
MRAVLSLGAKKTQDSKEFWEELERVELAAASPYRDDSHAFDKLHQFPGVVTHETILKLHQIALPGRDQVASLYRGQHGHQPTRTIWVGNHEACQNQHVQREMDKFLNWLNEKEAKIGANESMGIQKFVALVHYKIVKIHPFYAANGRRARVLLTFILMRHSLGPLSSLRPSEKRTTKRCRTRKKKNSAT